MSKTLITNAVFLDNQRQEIPMCVRSDAAGKIGEVAEHLQPMPPHERETVVDAKGMLILPGRVDTHVHLREPGGEHKEDLGTGYEAAHAGGITTMVEKPNTAQPITSLEAMYVLEARHDDRGFSGHIDSGCTVNNHEEMKRMLREPMSAGMKAYLEESTGGLTLTDEDALRKHLVIASDMKKVFTAHVGQEEMRLKLLREHQARAGHACSACCHGQIRSPESEIAGAAYLIGLIRKHKYPCTVLIAHVSVPEVLELVRRAKDDGFALYSEVTPHHLYLDEKLTERPDGTRFQVNPPLRPAYMVRQLREQLRKGMVDVIGTDHAPHTREEKAQPYGKAPSGLTGLETMLPAMLSLMHERVITPDQFRAMTGGTAAQLFGLHDRGEIAVGKRADLVLVDHHASWTVEPRELKTKAKDSPFAGHAFIGSRVMMTFVAGKLVYERSES